MNDKVSRIVIHDPHGNIIDERALSTEERELAIKEHNENVNAHPHIQTLVTEVAGYAANKVAGVTVNGNDVVNENKVAEINVPTKTSQLNNDSDFLDTEGVDAIAVSDVLVSNDGEEESKVVERDGKRVVVLSKDELGKVYDVKVNNVSVLDGNNEANINFTGSVENTSGDPELEITVENGVVDLAFRGLKGQTGKDGKVGPTGPQGATVVYGAGDLVLDTVPGQSQEMGMTQKAITDEFESDRFWSESANTATSISSNYINKNTSPHSWTGATKNTAGACYRVSPGKTYRISNYNQFQKGIAYAFVEGGGNSGTSVVYSSGWSDTQTLAADSEVVVVAPNDDVVYLYVSLRSGEDNVLPTITVIEHTKEHIIALGEELSNLGTNVNERLNAFDTRIDAKDEEISNVRKYAERGDIISDDTNFIPAETQQWTTSKVYINGNTGEQLSGTAFRVNNTAIYVRGYDYVRVSVCNDKNYTGVMFYDSNGDPILGSGACGRGDYATTGVEYLDVVLKVPSNAATLKMTKKYAFETIPYCYGIKVKGGVDKVQGINSYLDWLKKGNGYVLSERTIAWRNGYIDSNGSAHYDNTTALSNSITSGFLDVSKVKRIRKLANPEDKVCISFYDENRVWKKQLSYYTSDIEVLPFDYPYIRLWFAHPTPATAHEQVEIQYYDEDIRDVSYDYSNKKPILFNSVTSMGYKDMNLFLDRNTVLFTKNDAKPGEYVDFRLKVNAASPSGTYAYIELLDENGNRLSDPNGDTAAFGKTSSSSTDQEYSGWFEIPEGFENAILVMRGTTVTIQSIGRYKHRRLEEYSFALNRIDSIEFKDGYQTVLASNDEDASPAYETKGFSFGNVLKISDNMYYMYYYGKGQSDPTGQGMDAYGHILFAYSTDGLNWTRGFPSGVTPPIEGAGNEVLVFKDKIAEQHVFKVPDNEYPFRMIAGHSDLGNPGDYVKNMTSFWKSTDGIHWVYVRKIYNKEYDSQYNCIVRGNYIKAYMRMRNFDGGPIRYVGMMTLDLDGNMVSPPTAIGFRLFYNAGASVLDDRREIMFPTHYNEDTQEQYLACYIIDGDKVNKVDVDFSPLLEETDNSYYFFPGIINIGEDFYVYYFTRTSTHDTSDLGVSEIRRAKITFATTGGYLRKRD